MAKIFCDITGDHNIALIKGHEDYKTLQTGLKNVWYAKNKLMEQGFMEIDGNKVHLHFHLEGDYKVREIHVPDNFYCNCSCYLQWAEPNEGGRGDL